MKGKERGEMRGYRSGEEGRVVRKGDRSGEEGRVERREKRRGEIVERKEIKIPNSPKQEIQNTKYRMAKPERQRPHLTQVLIHFFWCKCDWGRAHEKDNRNKRTTLAKHYRRSQGKSLFRC